MVVHALGAHRTKHALYGAATYAIRLIARLIDDTVTSWLSKDNSLRHITDRISVQKGQSRVK